MAQIILTIPDALTTRILAGICGLHGYQITVLDPENPEEMIPNPETKSEFVKKVLLKKIKRDVLEFEGNEAQRNALLSGEGGIIL